MKQFIGYCVLFCMVICSVIFSACSQKVTKVGNFSFAYEKNSVEKIEENGEEYIKLKLKIKNTSNKESNLSANKFVLVKNDNQVSEQVVFGNNIIDQMEEEIFPANSEENIILNITTIEKISGTYQLAFENSIICTIVLP